MERRSSTSARGLMLSRLSDSAADDDGDPPMGLATAAVGSNGPLWSTSTLLQLQCSEKDVDTSDTVRLRLPAVSTRLRVDGDEQHPPRSPASEPPSDTETDELLSLSMASLVCSAPSPSAVTTPSVGLGHCTKQREHEMAL